MLKFIKQIAREADDNIYKVFRKYFYYTESRKKWEMKIYM